MTQFADVPAELKRDLEARPVSAAKGWRELIGTYLPNDFARHLPEDGDALIAALTLAEQVLAKSGVAGSALVIADNVAAHQVQSLATSEIDLPVQFLSVQAFNAAVDGGLQDAAASLGAAAVKLTVDSADVERLAGRAETSIKAVSASNEGTRWLDAGYSLVPLLALFALMWSRRGWLVR